MQKARRYIFLILLVGFFAELYFYPFQSEFKFSAAVVVLNLIVLAIEDVSEFWVALLSGFMVIATRTALLLVKGADLKAALIVNYPSLLFYMAYAFLIKFFRVRDRRNYIFQATLLLMMADVLSNLLEAGLRQNINPSSVRFIVAGGALRSVFAQFLYVLYQRQKLFILNEEHQKRYTQLNMLISDIQAEMFYLKKSMKDIENVMKKSYSLYERPGLDEKTRELALDIARDVHEIKKDYYRVVLGFETFLKNLENEDSMRLSSIFAIIRDNMQKYLKAKDKDIRISFRYGSDFSVKPFFGMFTVLNNLIANSVDACKDGGSILVEVEDLGEEVYFKVEDNGEGIEEDVLPYIFNPGFTTKYDEATGKPNTGIGLSHVQSIVKELGGRIDVDSASGKGTKFEIYFPKNSIVRG